MAFVVALGYRPHDPVFCFDIGVYVLIKLAIIAFFIIRDHIWRGKGNNLP